MAKELPYFQFEPAEYLTKDISFCSLSAQGLFINICSFYWQRQCNLTKAQVLRRFNYPDVLKELIEEGIIKTDENENIVISFLLSQYESIIEKKSNDSEKGKIGNLKRWHKEVYDKFIEKELSLNEALAIAKESGGDNLAIAKTSQIREDKIKEEKIINNNCSQPKVDWEKLLIQFNNITGKKSKVVNQKTKNTILARLKEGYSKQDLVNAIQNCFDDPYHKETNHKYLTLEFISRSDKMEKYSTIKEK